MQAIGNLGLGTVLRTTGFHGTQKRQNQRRGQAVPVVDAHAPWRAGPWLHEPTEAHDHGKGGRC